MGVSRKKQDWNIKRDIILAAVAGGAAGPCISTFRCAAPLSPYSSFRLHGQRHARRAGQQQGKAEGGSDCQVNAVIAAKEGES